MSARLLKKVLKEQEQLQQKQRNDEEEEAEEEEEVESPELATRPVINPFDLLNDDEADQESEAELADETSTREDDKQDFTAAKNVPFGDSTSNQKSKKKKKKKTKVVASSGTSKVEAKLDDAVKTLTLETNTSRNQPGPSSKLQSFKQNATYVLQVDPKWLNPENELRRIFGSKVVKSFERTSQSSVSRQVRGGRRGSHHIRKTMLVSPADHWPRWDGSLSMDFLEIRNGNHCFRYVHSSSYGQAQRAFESAKAIHDLNAIANILLHHPYHLDSLITMADYFKFVGEHQMSADAVSKSLYALECAWHPMFSSMLGTCQLKISHETNKPLFTTLFTHMKNLDRRGCHRSALEVCKLLLSLDSDDPMGSMFCIDYFALRAEEYAWLEQFSEHYKRDNSLWLFPNFSYSLAISRFYLEKEELSKDTHISTKKGTSAELMKQALMLHPSVVKKLVDKVPLKEQAWTSIIKHPFFRSEKTGSPSLDHLINIYVERSYILWRLPDLQKLLRDNALQVINTLEHNSSDAKDWACVRKEAFSSENNEYGHLMVSDFSDTVATLPPENLQDFMVDPRVREAELNGGQIAVPGHRAPAPRDVANRNALAVLFESMLPWVNYGGGEDAEARPENHVARQQGDDED